MFPFPPSEVVATSSTITDTGYTGADAPEAGGAGNWAIGKGLRVGGVATKGTVGAQG